MSDAERTLRPEEAHRLFHEALAREEARYVDPATGAVRAGMGATPTACAACGGPLGEARGGYAACRDCGTLNSSPRLDPKRLPELWTDDGAAAFFHRHVYAPTAARRMGLMRERAAVLAGLLPTGRVLEAGCSIGLFLDALTERGFHAEGVEVVEHCVETCRAKGHRVQRAAFEQAGLGEGVYDGLAAFEVLAHLADPRAFADRARRCLRSGGVLFLTTPNAAGLEYDTIWEGGTARHDNLKPHVFLQILTAEGLRRLLETAGFEVLRLETPGRMDVENIRNTALGESRRFSCGFFGGLFLDEGPEAETARAAFQKFLADTGRSGHMLLLARAGETRPPGR